MESLEDFVNDDELAIAPLAVRGVEVELVPWRRSTDWRRFEGVVIRSTSDFPLDPEAFFACLTRIEGAGTPLANPLEVARWNLHKSYLFDLERRGVPVVPTRRVVGLDAERLLALFDELDASEIVLKPAVGANAERTFRVRREPAEGSDEVLSALGQVETLAQPFVESVLTRGELSLFWIGGACSHAIRKRPAPGDFRVQEEHGGEITAIAAEEPLLTAAKRAIAAVPGELLYARVDLVELEHGDWRVMELELIEPSLYLRMAPEAPARLAEAVVRWLPVSTP